MNLNNLSIGESLQIPIPDGIHPATFRAKIFANLKNIENRKDFRICTSEKHLTIKRISGAFLPQRNVVSEAYKELLAQASSEDHEILQGFIMNPETFPVNQNSLAIALYLLLIQPWKESNNPGNVQK